MPAAAPGRETPGCEKCGSSVRLRSLVSAITSELCGQSVPLPDLPRLKSLRALGMSDPPALAEPLAAAFNYTNTFYHQEPRFDVVAMDDRHLGQFDFIVTSEVLEHVPPPIEQAFTTIYRMLKPNGVLIMTVPYTLEAATEEHFPALGEFAIAALRGETVLVNRARDGRLEVFENLVFHGGGGSTLEMRRFSEGSLRETLKGAGFCDVQIRAEDDRAHGVLHNETWSLPVVARKAPFAFRRESAAELVDQFGEAHRHAAHLEAELGRVNQWGRELEARLTGDLAERTEWARGLEHQLEERTRWALQMEAELKVLQRELEERTRWAQGLDKEVEDLRRQIAELESRKWVRLGRKFGLI
jgi:SAM-dependent methyltransferase